MAAILPAKPKQNKPKLLDQTRDVLRLKHCSLRTERSYCDWIERFIRFHQLRHPKEMGVAEITQFSGIWRGPAMYRQRHRTQALSALLFLYKEVFKHEIGWLEQVERAKKPQKMPAVQSRDEIKQIFAHAVDS